MATVAVTDDTFDAEVRQSDVPVVVRMGNGTVVADTVVPALDSVILNGLVVAGSEDAPVEVVSGGVVVTSLDSRILPGLFSILPPLLAIVLALVFREVVVSLFAGIWLGALFLTGFNPLTAIFETLGISQMRVSEQALREGLLYDLVGRLRHQDVRETTVQSAMLRWNLDILHASKVTETVQNLFSQVRYDWDLTDEHRDMLLWAAQLHEIGLQISHGAYHKRGAYILTHADLPGFSRPEQAMLAALVLNHRQRLRMDAFDDLVEPVRLPSARLCVLLRLAVLFHRGRTDEQVPELVIRVDGKNVELHFPYGWLDQHSLTQADLGKEYDYLKDANISLMFD